MSTEVVMPQMGESIAEGTITKWLKQVGDHVDRDEPLFEISTDKVDAEIPSPAAGTLTEIRFKEGDTVEVNTTVAVLDGESAGVATTTAPAPKVEASPQSTPKAEAPPEATVAQQQPQPQSAETAATPREAQVEAAAATEAEVQPAEKTKATSAPQPAQAPVESKPAVSERPDAAASSTGNGGSATASAEDLRRTKSSPLVRKIAQEHGVDIARLEGTGLSGRVTKNDILSFIESGSPGAAAAGTKQQPAAPARGTAAAIPEVSAPPVKPAEGDRVEQMSVMRKKISEHMVLSRRTSAHVTTVYEIDMTRVAKLREENKDSFAERTGTKLSFMPFIFQA
ncbi:MAG TPA: biotin/lipoyl-containing protein, partial [Pyrinomonadaceae bacterium]